MRRFRRVALALLLLPLALSAHAGGLLVGDRAPRGATELASGKVLAAGHLEGKVVLQYFWATWCPFCQRDLPVLEKLYQAYPPQGFEIIAQSLDDDSSIVIEFWQEKGCTFPVAMRSDKIRTAYGPIRGTPTLFLIDRKGTVRLKRLGAMPDGALEDEIKALLE